MEQHGGAFLEEILIFLVAAVLLGPLSRRLRLSPILGYLAAGIAVGPHGLALISDSDIVRTLAEFGVIFLLFTIGLELSVQRLRALRRLVFGLGSLQVVTTGILIAVVLLLFGNQLEASVLIGFALALSSTAFVLQLLIERSELITRHGRAAFAVLLLQDLAIVPLLTLVGLLGQEENGGLLGALFLAIAKAAAAIAATMLFGRYILRPAYRIIAATRSHELFVATTLLILLGVGYLMSLVGVSMALGAFLAGLLLSGTEYRHQVEADIRPFRGLLLGLFFMSVGLSIDLRLLALEPLTVFGGVALLMAIKIAVAMPLYRLFDMPWGLAVRSSFLISQAGEFGFVLIGAALATGIVPLALGQLVLAVIALSMLATPLIDFCGQKLAVHLGGKEGESPATPGIADIPESELTRHVVVAGFGRVGRTVARVLIGAGVPFVALERDPLIVRRYHGSGLPVFYGDVGHLEVLQAAGIAQARAAVITLDDSEASSHVVATLRASAPDLPIMARGRDLAHRKDLERAGASAVVPEMLEASLQLGALLLDRLGIEPLRVAEILDALRADNYAKADEPMTKLSEEGSRNRQSSDQQDG